MKLKTFGWALAVIIIFATWLPLGITLRQTYLSDKFDLDLKENGIKTNGRVLEQHLERRGKHSSRVATYEYIFQGQTYKGKGDIKIAPRSKDIVVYVSLENPNVSRADFSILDENAMRKAIIYMGAFYAALIFLSLISIYFIIVLPKKVLAYGQMESALVIQRYYGKSSGAKVQYVVNGVKYERRVQFNSNSINVNDRVPVVYDPAKPTRVMYYPFLLLEVENTHHHGPVVS